MKKLFFTILILCISNWSHASELMLNLNVGSEIGSSANSNTFKPDDDYESRGGIIAEYGLKLCGDKRKNNNSQLRICGGYQHMSLAFQSDRGNGLDRFYLGAEWIFKWKLETTFYGNIGHEFNGADKRYTLENDDGGSGITGEYGIKLCDSGYDTGDIDIRLCGGYQHMSLTAQPDMGDGLDRVYIGIEWRFKE